MHNIDGQHTHTHTDNMTRTFKERRNIKRQKYDVQKCEFSKCIKLKFTRSSLSICTHVQCFNGLAVLKSISP